MTIDYGRDTLLDTEGLRTGRVATGAYLVAQNAFWRLRTRKGQMPSDENYGLPRAIDEFLHAEVSDAEIKSLAGIIPGELYNDDRIAEGSIVVTLTLPGDTGSPYGRETSIVVTGLTSTAEPFKLVFTASDATIELLEGAS